MEPGGLVVAELWRSRGRCLACDRVWILCWSAGEDPAALRSPCCEAALAVGLQGPSFGRSGVAAGCTAPVDGGEPAVGPAEEFPIPT
jgi:hypothetical protein